MQLNESSNSPNKKTLDDHGASQIACLNNRVAEAESSYSRLRASVQAALADSQSNVTGIRDSLTSLRDQIQREKENFDATIRELKIYMVQQVPKTLI